MSIFFLFIFCFVKCAYSAKILSVCLYPSYSHHRIYQKIWQELSLRGHELTIFSPYLMNNSSLKNLTEHKVEFKTSDIKSHFPKNYLRVSNNMFQQLHQIFDVLDFVVKTGLESPVFQNLLSDQEQQFDLVILSCFHPLLYGLSWKFKSPMICVSSFGALAISQDVVLNPNHPVLYREFFGTSHGKNPSLLMKIQLVLLVCWERLWYHFVMCPRSDKLSKYYFGKDTPNVVNLHKNTSLYFLNTNFLIYPPRPNVPRIVELGFLHIEPVGNLPKNFQNFLDEAEEGAVYFSLGSITQVDDDSMAKKIIKVLSGLPYKVLMKWNCDSLLQKFENIMCEKWFPQQDILGHRNIKVFVTQGGLQSIEEAISREVPLVGLPFRADQWMNVQKISEAGIGLWVDPIKATADDLRNRIIAVASNATYKRRIKEVRKILYDRTKTSLDKAVWWCEYVIRHKGAFHLKSSTSSWFSYLLLDVVVTCLVLSISIIIFCRYLNELICRYLFNLLLKNMIY